MQFTYITTNHRTDLIPTYNVKPCKQTPSHVSSCKYNVTRKHIHKDTDNQTQTNINILCTTQLHSRTPKHRNGTTYTIHKYRNTNECININILYTQTHIQITTFNIRYRVYVIYCIVYIIKLALSGIQYIPSCTMYIGYSILYS